MNRAELKCEENYYNYINDVKLYVDYTNERLKILDYSCISKDTLMTIIEFAKNESLGKVISNCRTKFLDYFKNCNFKVEGVINGFFDGEDALCVSFFIDKKREISKYSEEEDKIIYKSVVENKKNSKIKKHNHLIRTAGLSDIPQMIKLFSNVFETYLSPVFSIDYLEKVMNDNILFKVAVENDKIISIASADMDKCNMNAEITDCATYPEHRGKGILTNLISDLEQELQQSGFNILYSLSRAINPGINKSLANLDYKYCGRLVNNCHICGTYEDMNIWVKRLNKTL